MKTIYDAPDGRAGREAYCYVTRPFESNVTSARWWSQEAGDCTDVRTLVQNRAFNALLVSL